MVVILSRVAAAVAFSSIAATFASGQRVVELGLNKATKAGKSEVAMDAHETSHGALFSVDLMIGTPPQKVTVSVDTGSSDLIIPEVNSPICRNPKNLCSPEQTDDNPYFPGLSSNLSTSFRPGSLTLAAVYGDQSLYLGSYAQETIKIGNASLSNVTFGLALNGSSPNPLLGIFGLSYMSNEAGVRNGQYPQYPNFPQLLKNQGLISTVAYSVYLNGEGKQCL